MKQGMIIGLIALGAIASATSVLADPPKVGQIPSTSKLLLPKTGGSTNAPAIEKMPGLPAALPQGEKTLLITTIAAAKPAGLAAPPRSPFVASPADLRVGSTETRLMFPRWVYPSFADFGTAGGFVIAGIADGAWYVDCSVAMPNGGALFVATSSKNSSQTTVSSSSGTMTPSNGHLTMGVYFNGGAGGDNTITVTKQDGFVWHRCELTPVP